MFMTKQQLAKKSLDLLGWKIEGGIPEGIEQCVMIAAPHTSNWDALYTKLGLTALGVNARITIKDSYMKFPFGPFVRAMGGIGINRRPKVEGEERQSMVEVMANLFNEHEQLVMLVTPEGTRSCQTEWKTGFYHVAKTANVPIALAYINYSEKTVGIADLIYPSEDFEADMQKIMSFYATIPALFPEKFSVDQRYTKK